jgi:hypothetical protein
MTSENSDYTNLPPDSDEENSPTVERRPIARAAVDDERTLERRAIDALTDDAVSSDALADLLSELDAAIQDAEATAKLEAERALDPALTDDPNQADQAAKDALIRVGRLRTILPRTLEKRASRQAAEQLQAWYSDYLDFEAEQAALAEEFAQTYQRCLTELVDCFARMANLDVELSRLHMARPAGVKEHLVGVELKARGLTGFTLDTPSIIKAVQLPEFENSRQMAWPPKPEINTAVFAPVPYDPRYSRQWHKTVPEQQRQRESEREATSRYYDQRQQRREAREGAEAEERRRQARR